MKIETKRLVSKECFESLKIGDNLLIKWDKTTRDNANKKPVSPMITRIREIKEHNNEIILEEPDNLYFNYMMYLNPDEHGHSRCRLVELVNIK